MVNYKNRILVIIVTYNPELKFLCNNLKKFNGKDVLIIDNNSKNISQIVDLVISNNSCALIDNKTNLGIAEALNQGLKYATDNGYKYILTMDQDSSFANDYLSLEDGFNYTKDVAIVCPSIIDNNSKNEDIANLKYDELFVAITSGCLCDVLKLNEIGGFDSKLFIDYVDFDICIKLQIKKYKILRSKDVILNHTLGESKIFKVLGIKFISTNHNPLRRYYNSRNRVYLTKKYFSRFPKYFINNILSFLKTIFIIAIFENNKKNKISAIYRGVIDGIKLK